MAGFPKAECLSFIKKNDTKIPILIDYNMVKVMHGEVSKQPGNVFYS